MRIIVLLLIFFTYYSYSTEYWYPVGCFNQKNGSIFFYIHQVSSDSIELWSWNSITEKLQKELPSHFNPAGFRLLPNQKGFSFIDNGIIRVKYFDKRSPKSLEIYKPVYDINVIHWKDSNTCYFHAKYQNNYGIFQLTQQGELNCIIKGDVDYLYPHLVENKLFYIKRAQVEGGQYRYKIMAIEYPIITMSTKEDIIQQLVMDDNILADHVDKQNETIIFDFTQQPIGYLHMVSKKEGFVLAYPTEINKGQQSFECEYYHLKFSQNQWTCVARFPLIVPTKLLFDNDQRLYEGIVPLLLFTD